MGTRLELDTILRGLVANLYFQPPSSITLKYPCIIYARDYSFSEYGDNMPYSTHRRYLITVIDKNPDTVIPDKVEALPMCVFDRYFTADNLNHYTFKLYS